MNNQILKIVDLLEKCLKSHCKNDDIKNCEIQLNKDIKSVINFQKKFNLRDWQSNSDKLSADQQTTLTELIRKRNETQQKCLQKYSEKLYNNCANSKCKKYIAEINKLFGEIKDTDLKNDIKNFNKNFDFNLLKSILFSLTISS